MRGNQNNRVRPLSLWVGFLILAFFAGFVSIGYSQASDVPLTISDIVSEVTPTGFMSINWKTNKPADSLVEYSIDESFNQRQKIVGLFTDRSVTLPRLTPNTLYHYHVVSVSADGERVVGPHLLFNSPTQADLKISDIHLRSDFHWYDQERPLLGAQGLHLQISNSGQEPITQNFSISFILSQTIESDQANVGYSCFAQYEHQRTLPAETVETILLDSDLFSHCDILSLGSYTLTAAIDYDDQISEADETNNVVSLELAIGDRKQVSQFVDIKTTEIQATSASIIFSIEPAEANRAVVVDVAPDYYYQDHPGMYIWSQDTLYASSTYSTLIKGLQGETLYHYRLRFLDSNVTSADQTFRTILDVNADSNRLLNLKLTNPSCRLVEGKPLGVSYWQDLGLNVPAHEILHYRILWSSGNWSPWYTPGMGDEDWQLNTHGNPRRVWSYFQDHHFEYETCGSDIATGEQKPSDVPAGSVNKVPSASKDETKYGQRIARAQEMSDPVVKRKIDIVQQALRFYRRAVSAENWQTIQDAYVYGGYSLSELEQTLRRDTGIVHPTIPAVAWRKQSAAGTSVAVTNH
jgi:hypothetical protein